MATTARPPKVIASNAYLCAGCWASRVAGVALPHRDETGCVAREAGREQAIPWSAQVLGCVACRTPPPPEGDSRPKREPRGITVWLCAVHGPVEG